jgi:hypothetical protein
MAYLQQCAHCRQYKCAVIGEQLAGLWFCTRLCLEQYVHIWLRWRDPVSAPTAPHHRRVKTSAA